MQQLLAAPSPTLPLVALALPALAPLVQLAPRMYCTDCDGDGSIDIGQRWSDGMIFDEPCRACSGTGMVANPDYDPNEPSWFCRCPEPSVLCAGEGCRGCDADAPERVS